MKKLLRKIIHYFGYELKKRTEIFDAISYNSSESAAAFYRNEKLTHHYIEQEVKPIVAQILQLLEDQDINLNNKKVLDVSCGTGHFLAAVKEKFPTAQVAGTEYTNEVYPLIRKLIPELEITLLDIEKKSLNEVYDAVCCTFVLEHLQDPDAALLNLMKMVKTEGILLLTVPDGRADDFAGHIFFWGKYSWNLLLKKCFPNNIITTGYMPDGKNLFGIVYNR